MGFSLDTLLERIRGLTARVTTGPVGRIALNMRPLAQPWGGGNQWLQQIILYLRRAGYEILHELSGSLDAIIVVDPRRSPSVPFALEEIRAYKEHHHAVRVIHRVNENDLRKGTGSMDAQLERMNAVADFTVFISQWLRDYHAARWFDRSRPHEVIHNGADPAEFHPIGAIRFDPAGPLRLVTHHWSDNPMKGFGAYREIDDLIARGELPRTELWVIGRWPAEITWKAARTFPPTRGRALAGLLRQCHLYVTASRWEPGGMHFIEGAQCGLPLLYHRDGGGINELGSQIGLEFGDDVGDAIERARKVYVDLKAAVLDHPPAGDRMCYQYRVLVQKLLGDRNDAISRD